MPSNLRIGVISIYFIIAVIVINAPTKVLTTAIGKDQVFHTSYPIVIGETYSAEQPNYSGHYGARLSKSFFGYSVSLDKGTGDLEEGTGWVFIGAPKSNTSSGNAYSNDDVEPGVMWRCSLGAGEDKCEMMIDPLVEKIKIRETIRIYLNTEEIAIEEPKDFKFTVEAEVSFNDKRVLPFTTRGTLPMKFQPTRAVISGNNMLDEFLRGVGNYYAQEVRTPSLYTKESIDIVRSRRVVNLYTPIRQKFVVTVKGTSVSKAIAKFQIPIFWRDPENRANSKSLFLISYHDNSNKVNCKATSQAQSLSTVQPITFDSQTSAAVKYVHHAEKLRRRRRAAKDTVNQTQDMDTSTVNAEVSQDNLPTTAPPKQAVPSSKDDALVINCVSESDCLVVECEINK